METPFDLAYRMYIDIEFAHGQENVPDALNQMFRFSRIDQTINGYSFLDLYRDLTDQIADKYESWSVSPSGEPLMFELHFMARAACDCYDPKRFDSLEDMPIGSY